MADLDPLIIAAAVAYLRRQAETVEPAGLGLWRVNGDLQTSGDLVAYANDLRRLDALSPFRPPSPGSCQYG